MYKKIINNTGVQLVSLVSILIISVIFIMFYVGVKINSLVEINSLHNDLNRFTTVSVQLKNNLEEFKRYNHTDIFYETSKDASTEKVVNAEMILFNIINNLLKNKDAERYGIFLYIKQNEDILNEFNDKYALLIKNIIEIGNYKYGYVEKLNYSELRLENNLNNEYALKKSFNNIKLIKAQYFQSLNFEVADEFIKQMQKFINKSKNSYSENQNNKRLITDASSQYLNNFIQITKLYKHSGIVQYRGLYSELDKLSSELIYNISLVIDVSRVYIQNDYKTFKIKLILLVAFSLFIILLILFLMYRFYHKGISKILNEIKSLVFEQKDTSFFKVNYFLKNISNLLLQHKKDIDYKKFVVDNFVLGIYNKEYIFDEKDALGQSIVNLQGKILDEINKSTNESQKRVIEDKHKEGIVKFGRILRRHVGDIDTLSYELISELVSFLNAEIGGFYVASMQDDVRILDLKASFAYNEKKLIKKQIPFGEGLIGTCAVDKSTFFIDKVDDDYIKIVSGFGHTKPTSIIISPIMVDEEVYGVIELGATRLFNKNDIDFIESLAEDIAYTLSYLLSLEGNKK